MSKSKRKKRQSGSRRVVETALPKRQYKRTNRLLYVFSGILLVVFGGGAALVGAGTSGGPPPPQPQVPAISGSLSDSPAGQQEQFTTTPTPVPPTPVPATPVSPTATPTP